MIIKGAYIYNDAYETDEKIEIGNISIKGIEFVDGKTLNEAEEEIIDGRDCYAIPGLVDIHFHGCVGRDFCDGTEEAIDAIAAYEASEGITSIVPATMTMGADTLYQVCEAAAVFRKKQEAGEKQGMAVLCGINMEGPFVSREKMGAQNPNFIQPANRELYDNMQRISGGMIKLVAIAPETEGAMDFIRAVKDETVLSVAHTMADYDIAMEAFEAGATHVTHLYNAMKPYTHRAPGVVGAAADAGADAELICDGVHLHPAAVRTTFKMLGKDKIILISDSMMATGLEDGDYSLGGQPVKVVGNRATLADGTIAGSATNLMNCMRTAIREMHIPFAAAVKCATENPARSVGIFDKYGSIDPGKVANLVLLDRKDLSVKMVILQGKIIKRV